MTCQATLNGCILYSGYSARVMTGARAKRNGLTRGRNASGKIGDRSENIAIARR